MADVSDVESALAVAVVSALYPAGVGSPSVTGQQVRVYRGWPLTGPLGIDLGAGIANVSIFAVPGATRNTTRWAPTMQTTAGVPSLTVNSAGGSVTFGGTGGVGQLAGVLVDGRAFVYRGRSGDTATLVAATLADQIRNVQACWLSGMTLSCPGSVRLIGRVAADGLVQTEWTRQQQGFRISAWCPDPVTRDVICSALGGALAATSFVALADGTGGRIRYRATSSFDDAQDAQMYRRDLIYDVEYPTSTLVSTSSMLFGNLIFDGATFYG